jgi:hypothetical protein
VVVNGDREDLLGVILADDIVIENFADFFRSRNAVARLHKRGFVFLADDVHAQLDAFIADENSRASDKLADFVLALAAERAIKRVLGVTAANFAHSILRRISRTRPRSLRKPSISLPTDRCAKGTAAMNPSQIPSLPDNLTKHAKGGIIKNPLMITGTDEGRTRELRPFRP